MTEGLRPIPVAIIGAGLGGISTAIALQSQLGFYDYEASPGLITLHIYEMAGSVGGTWRENTYPGCACDVPTHWYSLSTEPNPDWSQMFSGHQEIREYWEKIALKHNVNPHIKFYSEVLSAVWDDDTQLYTITIQDVRTKDIRHVQAQVVVSAVGFFNVPKWPEVPGRDTFKGISIHARMWDHSVDFSGKRVAVIGNGCSGTQIVPVLSEDPTTEIIHFCRTPSWFLPRPQAFIPDWVKWTFRNIPLTGTLFRWALAAQIEAGYAHWKVGPLTSALRRRREQKFIQRVKELTPPKYHKNLIPDFPMGCKRIIMDPGYLDSLRRPNIDLEWDPIVQITEHGITTKSGKTHEVDIICYATGFDVANSSSMKVTGIAGRSMGDYFREQGGPVAYLGTTVPGFPNWFILLGPNTGTGLGSVIYSEEVQINYAMQLIEPVIHGKAKGFTPKVEASDAYNQKIQADLKHTVWTSCASWYRAGDPRQGRIFGTWPATQTYLWWLLRKPIWSDYETIDGEKWIQSRRRLEVFKGTLEVLLLGAGLGAFVLARTGKWVDASRLLTEYSRQLFA